MQLICVQLDTAWERPSENFSSVVRLLEGASVKPGALVVLPEMFAVGFTVDGSGPAEDLGGPTEQFLRDTAMRFSAFVLGGVLGKGSDGRRRNDALAVGPDGRPVARYTKLHPFSYAGEAEHFEPGHEVVLFPWAGFQVAPFICYDVRFPEPYRKAAACGADLLITIANFPSSRREHWSTLLVARAVENQAWSIGVNRCGVDPNEEYPGRSAIIDPFGRRLVECGSVEETVSIDIDPQSVRSYRNAFPALRDMRASL